MNRTNQKQPNIATGNEDPTHPSSFTPFMGVHPFSSSPYRRLAVIALIVTLFGAGLLPIASTFSGAVVIKLVIAGAGLFFAGIGIIGLIAAISLVLTIGKAAVQLDDDTLTIKAGSQELFTTKLADIRGLLSDYESVGMSKGELRFRPANPIGLRLITDKQTALIKGSLMTAATYQQLQADLTARTGLNVEKLRLQPLPGSARIHNPALDLRQNKGWVVLTDSFIAVYKDQNERLPIARKGAVSFFLPLNQLARTTDQSTTQILHARDGLEYELKLGQDNYTQPEVLKQWRQELNKF